MDEQLETQNVEEIREHESPLQMVASVLEGVPLEARTRLLTTGVTRTNLLRLAMKGVNATEAARMLNISPQSARSHYSDPSFRQAVFDKLGKAFEGVDDVFSNKKKNLHELLEEQAYSSFLDLVGMLEDKDLPPSLRMRINQDILNRTLQTAQVSKNASLSMTPDQLAAAAQTAREMDNVIPFREKEKTA